MKEYRRINNHYGIKSLVKYATGMNIPSTFIACNLHDFQNDAVYSAGYYDTSKKYHGFCTFTVGDGDELIAYYDYYYDYDTNELEMTGELYTNNGHLMGSF